jgi:hypothetical protein
MSPSPPLCVCLPPQQQPDAAPAAATQRARGGGGQRVRRPRGDAAGAAAEQEQQQEEGPPPPEVEVRNETTPEPKRCSPPVNGPCATEVQPTRRVDRLRGVRFQGFAWDGGGGALGSDGSDGYVRLLLWSRGLVRPAEVLLTADEFATSTVAALKARAARESSVRAPCWVRSAPLELKKRLLKLVRSG